LAPDKKGKSRDKVAAYTGRGRTSLAKAKEIVSAAKDDPKQFGPLLKDMDRTGRVNGPYKRLKGGHQSAQASRWRASRRRALSWCLRFRCA
jgi:hypothetical protein